MDAMMRPDERAAGVISGSDPYRELELYLEKVNEEIGEVFDQWRSNEPKKRSPAIPIPPRSTSRGCSKRAEQPPAGTNGSNGAVTRPRVVLAPSNGLLNTRSLPARFKERNAKEQFSINTWSEGLLAEFNSIIAEELKQLGQEQDTSKDTSCSMRPKKVSRSLSWEDDGGSGGDRPPRRPLGLPMLRRRRAERGAAVLVSVSPLPDADYAEAGALHKTASDSDIPRRRPRAADAQCGLPKCGSAGALPPPAASSCRDGGMYKDVLRRGCRERSASEERPPVKPRVEAAEDGSGALKRCGSGVLPVALQSLLTKMRPRRGASSTPTSPPASPSRCRSPQQQQQQQQVAADAGTQTSPPISRSSSFTWVSSDCSSSLLLLHTPGSVSDTMDDDNRSTTSSAEDSPGGGAVVYPIKCDCTSSRDSLSDSPLGSLESPDREEPESGIGTASPPRSKSAVCGGGGNKPRRKETWERLRRRSAAPCRPPPARPRPPQDVWVRRESVETQTTAVFSPRGDTSSPNLVDSSSGVDDAAAPDEDEEDEDEDSMSRGKCRTLTVPPARPDHQHYHHHRPARPRCLPVKPTRGFVAASPMSASLKLSPTVASIDLGNKSSSAPILAKQRASPGPDDAAKKRMLKQPRSQSERHISEIEAAEACKWLRAAGFPQYAQMYEDLQFPIDVSGVQKDHPFLDPDSLQSLFRRLHALNRCANMKVDNVPKNKVDDSDEDDSCALSENWTFQPEIRRWSRVCDVAQHAERLQALSAGGMGQDRSDEEARPAKLREDDGEDEDEDDGEAEEDYDLEEIPVISSMRYGSLPPSTANPGDPDLLSVRFRRTGSERLRDGAKALLRRMESLKSRRRRRQNREGVVISGPQVLDVMTMQQRMKDLNCVDVSPTSPVPPVAEGLPPPAGDDSSSYCSDGSCTAVPAATVPNITPAHGGGWGRTKATRSRRSVHGRKRPGDVGALSDSECQPTSWRHQYFKDANSNHTKVLQFVDGSSRGPQDQEPARRSSGGGKPLLGGRGGSLNLGKDSQLYRDKLQHGLRKDVTVYREKSVSPDHGSSQDSSSTLASQPDSDHDEVDVTPRHKAVVVRWHSFQRGSSRPDSLLVRQDSGGGMGVPGEGGMPGGTPAISSLSCGQLLVLRKLALLKLTACMERYCPTHRTGWNWELPKFIRKIKTPDYKDKTVFGVPLLVSLQRDGQALPRCIQAALRWLRVNALDQVGLFRKSGVRSRIQKLKGLAEGHEAGQDVCYEGQQAYDVADMVKQYFRELPEALLTNKLSETFIAIFQHVPVNLRTEAVQCVLLLLPDEHREALQTLLEFLGQVSARSACNQMTASNLAVCLAPSLFHLHHAPSAATTARSASASPRRRKTVGVPDPRELSENKAAHDCLLYLVREHKDLFVVPEEMMTQCHFNYMEESVPVVLEELGAELHQDWRGYLYTCTTALLKEAREKSRGWVGVQSAGDAHVDIAYKKVGDGHPLRLWRVSTEVEAPPQEVMQRLLRERHVWDASLLKWRVVARLDAQAEVFQYVCANMPPLAAKDFCVLRSWRSDLPKGACVIVETSVEHPDGPVMLGGVRGIVLASRYLIEPCGSGKSRIMHLSRVDTKGRTPEWYNKSYGHICGLYLTRIRSSFKHSADGPESKV